MTDDDKTTRLDFDEALDELAKVQKEVVDALVRGARLAAEAKMDPDEVHDGNGLEKAPLEQILREMVAQNRQAAIDREQVARLLVLLERLNIKADLNASGMDRIESAAAEVALDLAAAHERADEVQSGEAGAAADAAAGSPPEVDGVSEGT